MSESMQRLKKELAVKYPPHHYNHVPVFSAFWHLVEVTDDNEEVKE